VLGWILLAIWLLNKVFDQNGTRSPTDNRSSSSDSVSSAQSYGSPKESRPYGTYSANPNSSPSTIRRALPIEANVRPSPPPVATASEYTAPVESTALTPAIPTERTYRVVGVTRGDFLYLRAGPGSDYPAVARIHPGMRGITLESNRIANGSTTWQKISVGEYTGWVNEIYLEPENLVH
jgi:hypothetical protein